MESISTTIPSNPLTTLNEDCVEHVFKYFYIRDICSLLQTNRVFTRPVEKCNRKNKPIITLKMLPPNSKLFENICYFQVKYKGRINDMPDKENETHLIDFECTDKSITENLLNEL